MNEGERAFHPFEEPVFRRGEDLQVAPAIDAVGRHVAKKRRSGVAEGGVHGVFSFADHVDVHRDHAHRIEMAFDLFEEFDGRHLEGGGDGGIGVDHDHVVLLFGFVEPSAAIVAIDVHVFGAIEIAIPQVDDGLVDLDAIDLGGEGEVALVL